MTKIKSMIFLDGEFWLADEGLIESLLPWNLEGEGVFETIRAYAGRFFLLEEHLNRLQEGLKRLNVSIHYPKSEIEKYLYQTLQANKLKNARLRVTVWQVENRVRISVVAAEYRSSAKEQYQKGLKAIISSIRLKPKPNYSSVKSIHYFPYIQSFCKAEARGCQEAILLNERGEVVEGSRSNLFFVQKEQLYTPALKSGCLNGITRQMVIELSRKLGLPVKTVVVKPQDLLKAEEIFLTNSLIELLPLTQLNHRVIGEGKMGPITARLLKGYREIIKTDTSSQL